MLDISDVIKCSKAIAESGFLKIVGIEDGKQINPCIRGKVPYAKCYHVIEYQPTEPNNYNKVSFIVTEKEIKSWVS